MEKFWLPMVITKLLLQKSVSWGDVQVLERQRVESHMTCELQQDLGTCGSDLVWLPECRTNGLTLHPVPAVEKALKSKTQAIASKTRRVLKSLGAGLQPRTLCAEGTRCSPCLARRSEF